MSQHYAEALAKDKLKLLAELIERAKLGQDELNADRLAIGKSKLDNKWWRGVNIVKTAPDYSPVLKKFLERTKDGGKLSHKEVYAAFDYIRKFDDNLLKKLKLTKGDQIHHAIGYSEFARSVSQLSPDDQVKAFSYLSENDFPLGTTPSNTKYGALGQPAHMNPDSVGNAPYLSAHFKNNGVPLKLDTIPTNYDEWVNTWTNKIVPQAYTGAAVGMLVDADRTNKIVDAMTANPEGLQVLAKKYGVTPEAIVSTIFNRSADAATGDSVELKASRAYAKSIGLDDTISSFKQGSANERLIIDQLDQAGMDPNVVQRQLPNPASIDGTIFKPGNAVQEVLDNVSKIVINSGGARFMLKSSAIAVPAAVGGIALSGLGAVAAEEQYKQEPSFINDVQRRLAQTELAADTVAVGATAAAVPTLGASLPVVAGAEAVSMGAGLINLSIDGGKAYLNMLMNPKEVTEEELDFAI
jgi:hypothetical protein